MSDSTSTGESGEEPIPQHMEPYGFMEREVAFKLLASHAMVDRDFFYRLRDEPQAAAEELHIALSERDLTYLANDVNWEYLESIAEPVRKSLTLEHVTNSW